MTCNTERRAAARHAPGALCCACILWLGALPALAQEDPPPPPPMPSPGEIEQRQEIEEPEVTIRHEEGRTIEEYRVGGQLQYIKVTPDQGAPYYFIDTDGDGILDTRDDTLENPNVNQWILLRW